MIKDEALRMALEALEWNLPVIEDYGVPNQLKMQHKAITSIYEALAQPEQTVDWEKLYRLEVKKKDALAAKYERDIKPLTKIVPMAQPEQKYTTTRNAWTGKAAYKCNICGRDGFRSEHTAAFHECGEKAQQEPVIDKSAAIRIATSLGWEPKRKPLTDEEISEIVRGTHNTGSFVRAIEAKLKQKNQ